MRIAHDAAHLVIPTEGGMNPGDGDAMCGTTGSADALQAAFAALGAPLALLELPEPTIRAMYGADWLLLRPDPHAAWRGNAPPPAMLANHVTRHG